MYLSYIFRYDRFMYIQDMIEWASQMVQIAKTNVNNKEEEEETRKHSKKCFCTQQNTLLNVHTANRVLYFVCIL